uniref:Reverse transcriptase domain-containing protein n=1 Tax=Beta vulgaris subsp. vulgaris TaxID=3555 RepID=F4NCI4_BETVV|nr:hypothetical protein [Beta vulgaris subsp. vulgaris]
MNHILSWNCRGMGSPSALSALRRLLASENPQIVFLSETKLKSYEMESVKKKLKWEHMVAVDCEGECRKRRGGLAMLWRSEIKVQVMSMSSNHIDIVVGEEAQGEWRFTGIYGYPEEEHKDKTGALLSALARASRRPWLCGGDFNLMLVASEKKGGDGFNSREADIFRNAMEECHFMDLGFVGYEFTWTNNRGGDANIQERLDRFVANDLWKIKFPGSFVSHLPKRKSDHVPIVASVKGAQSAATRTKKSKRFRFEAMWLREGESDEVVKETWMRGTDAGINLARTANKLLSWSKQKFGHVAKEIRMCQHQMKVLMESEPSEDNIMHMRALDARMDELEKREEVYWHQRSRQDWIKSGDKNTKFFHQKASHREQRNNVRRIRNEAGEWFEDEDDVTECFAHYFENLFQSGNNCEMDPILNIVKPQITDELGTQLDAPFRREEVSAALAQMHPNKAPGPDGMNALFYQHFWDTIGEDVTTKVLNMLNNVDNIGAVNQTHIVLIPKKKHCESPVDFRPISLCNVLYKIVAKVLANRMKMVLPMVIHESQSGFVPGRLITDNVLVAYECFHFLRKKKTGKKGYLGLKLDMSKAYDRVEWCFLENMMLKLGFPTRYTKLVMNCVTSARFSVLVNGQPSRNFFPSRGLRQGDPLSPFLFVVCAEGLSTLLRDAEEKKVIHGVKIGHRVSPISHLFFADDSLLFIRATEEEVENVMDILSTYEAASGQKLNMEKSEMSYSRNLEPDKINTLQMKLAFKTVEGHEKYLGLPTFIGSSKKRVFQAIQDRVWKKLKGWKGKYLSQAGREVLIKAVAQAIPTYAMQCFVIPKSIIDGIEKMCRNFFWGQKEEERRVAWVAWEKLFLPKKEGGLGIRNFDVFNRALLAKQAWRILTKPDSLMARVIKGKYFPRSNFLEARVSPNMSFTCKSILSARAVIQKGMCRVIGDGRDTTIWGDPWVPSLERYSIAATEGVSEDDGPQKVCELISNDRWNVELLNTLFQPWESTAIQRIPVALQKKPDQWMWMMSKNGQFTVRSAYYHELLEDRKTGPSTSRGPNLKLWQKIWKAKIPPKVKLFSWKAIHNGLAVYTNMRKRGMNIDGACPRCGEKEETTEHLIWGCDESSRAWYISPLRIHTGNIEAGSFRIWVESLLDTHKDTEWWALFWMICWNIWLGRNKWVFEKKKLAFQEVVERAVRGVMEFEEECAHTSPVETLNTHENGWSVPPVGMVKLNVDAAVFKHVGIGMGGVVRDAEGDVLLATCCGGWAMEDPAMAEACSLRYGLKVAYEAGFRNLVVEMDCKKLFLQLRGKASDVTPFGRVVDDILYLASKCSNVVFEHVKRHCNKVAHLLAQMCKNAMEKRVWLEEYPSEVSSAVLLDKIS